MTGKGSIGRTTVCPEAWLPVVVLAEGRFDCVSEDHIPCKTEVVCVPVGPQRCLGRSTVEGLLPFQTPASHLSSLWVGYI